MIDDDDEDITFVIIDGDADEHVMGLEYAGMLDENFGDPESLMNSRDWLEKTIIAGGAKVHGMGIGMGRADLSIELEGWEYTITMKPILKEKS